MTVSRAEGVAAGCLLAVALLFGAVLLAPELRIGRAPLNDVVMHLPASERLAQSVTSGEPFLEPWVSEWALGYPVWRSYQPLPHLAAGLLIRTTSGFASPAATFAALQYLLMVLLPLSVYGGARLLGLGPGAAALAGALAILPSEAGDLSKFGLGYGSMVWRGTGLYTQLVALHVLCWALGATTRAIDSGRGRALAAFLLAVTALCHIILAYVAFVSAAVLAVVGPSEQRSRRLVRLGVIGGLAVTLMAWFVIPLFLGRHDIAHSRWERAWKWDSFGARYILGQIASGGFFDAGRPPVLSVLVALGAALAATTAGVVPRRLVALAALWLVLFFGRATWGPLMTLAAIPRDFHLHRLEVAFELAAVLLAAWGAAETVARLAARRRLQVAALVILGVALAAAGVERGRFLVENARLGEANLAAQTADARDLNRAFAAIRRVLAERPGRVSAVSGTAASADFRVGDVPVFALLSLAHFDQNNFLYHAMSTTADVMGLFDPSKPAQASTFAVRAAVAPIGVRPPAYARLRGTHGRFAVWELSREGYFGVVDVAARYTGPSSALWEINRDWLGGRLPEIGTVLALDGDVPGVPAFDGSGIPPLTLLPPAGRVVSEQKVGERYGARLALERSAYALVKVTWYPGLRARVDGVPAPLLRVTPGFGAIPVPAGEHEVAVEYAPGPLKGMLLLGGIVVFVAGAVVLRGERAITAEVRLADGLAVALRRVATPAVRLGGLATLALVVALQLLWGRTGAKPDDAGQAALVAARATDLGPILADLRDATRTIPASDAADRYYRAGKARWDADDKPGALVIWTAGAAVLPEFPSLWRNVGLCRYALGSFVEAAADLRHALALAPDDPTTRTDLAWALLAAGDLDGAAAASDEVLRRRPEDPAARVARDRVAAARAGR